MKIGGGGGGGGGRGGGGGVRDYFSTTHPLNWRSNIRRRTLTPKLKLAASPSDPRQSESLPVSITNFQ